MADNKTAAALGAKYLVEELAAPAVEEAIRLGEREVSTTFHFSAMDNAYEAAGLEKPAQWSSGSEIDKHNLRMEELATEKLVALGYEGRFWEEERGEPFYGGGNGTYMVLRLELKF